MRADERREVAERLRVASRHTMPKSGLLGLLKWATVGADGTWRDICALLADLIDPICYVSSDYFCGGCGEAVMSVVEERGADGDTYCPNCGARWVGIEVVDVDD